MLILGGTGIGLLLLLRIAIVKCLRCIKNNQVPSTDNLSPVFFLIFVHVRLVATTWPAVSASLVATWCTTSCSWSPSSCGWSPSPGGSSGTCASENVEKLFWLFFRHRVGPDALYSLVGEEQLNNFRASLGDKDVIHVVQFTDPDAQDYCDRTLYMVAFVILTAGWSVDHFT